MKDIGEATRVPKVGSEAAARRPGSLATWKLAIVESRRLLGHPAVLAGAALSLLVMVQSTWEESPVLHRADIGAARALLILAAAALLAANASALRSSRWKTEEMLAVAPVPPHARTVAHLLATIGLAGLAMVVTVAYLLSLVPAEPVGRPQLAELLAGPLAVALGASIGIILARWAPAPGIAPLVVVALAVPALGSFFLGTADGGDSRIRWLLPVVGGKENTPELEYRPSGWHLVYLIALVALTGTVARLRHAKLTRSVLAILVATTVLLAVSVTIQLGKPTAAEHEQLIGQYVGLGRKEHCERRNGVAYCALPGFRGWIDQWAEAIQPVVAQLPTANRVPLPTVRQQAPVDQPPTPTPRPWEVRTGLSWGRHGAAVLAREQLAMDYAIAAVGLPPRGTLVKAPRKQGQASGWMISSLGVAGICSAAGQARSVVALWLGAQTDVGHGHDLRDRTQGAMPWFGDHAMGYASQLLDRPAASVGPHLRAHWSELTAPATPISRAVELLDLQFIHEPQAPYTLEQGAPPLPRCPA